MLSPHASIPYDVIYWKRDIESGRGWVSGKEYKVDAELQMRESGGMKTLRLGEKEAFNGENHITRTLGQQQQLPFNPRTN